MEVGREISLSVRRDTYDLLQRGVLALEKLASDPVVEIEAGEPLCPNCGEFDPEIMIEHTEGGQGRLSEFIIEARCMACNQKLYGICDSFNMHQSLATVEQLILARRAENEQNT